MKLIKPKPNFSDQRGTITDLFYNDNIEHVTHIKTIDISAVRGNHYHKLTTQAMFMTQGSLIYWYKKLEDNETKSIRINKGEIVITPPNEIHALTFDEKNEFLVFTWGLRGGKDYEQDTYRVDSIIG